MKLDRLGLHDHRWWSLMVSNGGHMTVNIPNDWEIVGVLNCALPSAKYLSHCFVRSA